MKSFSEIYNSIHSNFEPQKRSLKEIGVILAKAYSILRNPKFERISPFTPGNETIDIDRTTVERLVEEIEQVQTKGNGSYFVSNEGIERAIADIQTLHAYALNPNIDFYLKDPIASGSIKAYLRFLIQVSRTGLIFTRQKKIQDDIASLESKDAKLNYLYNTLFSLKQKKKLWDNFQYDSILEFIELEISKWIKYSEDKNYKQTFESVQQLYEFIIKLLQNRLQHNIQYLEGYRVFWRDELCQQEPKKENEIHHFIKSILKPYCDEYGVKIMRENAIANGKIDMTFAYLNFSVCLEVKKAHHQDIITAINTQLTDYMIGEETQYGIYLILWYKSKIGFKKPANYQNIDELISEIEINRDDYQYRILGIDCSKPVNPTKKK